MEVLGAQADMHLLAAVPKRSKDRQLSERVAKEGLWAMPLSPCYLEKSFRPGFILGYGGTDAARRCVGSGRSSTRVELESVLLFGEALHGGLMSEVPPRSHPLSQEVLTPAVDAVVSEFLSGRLLRRSPKRAESLRRLLLREPTPGTFEGLLERLYTEDAHEVAVEVRAFALVRLATRLFGAPSRLGSVNGDLVVSNHQDGATPSPLWISGHLKVSGSLRVDEGAWLLCTGDVQVGSVTLDYEPGSVIAVGGALSTKRMSTMGAVVVGGRLEVADTLLAWRNDYRLVVEGGLRAGLLVAWDHTVDAEVEDTVRLDAESDEAALRQHLREEVFTGEPGAESFDVEAADALLQKNDSLRRSPA